MRLLLKFPTKSRPSQALAVLAKYVALATRKDLLTIIVSLDADDEPSCRAIPQWRALHPTLTVHVGPPGQGKIAAVNRNMPDPSTFDILLLGSDDMVPLVSGYDDIIREAMQTHFPDRDGVLHFNDGLQGPRLNTLVICGAPYYARFNYIYAPVYKSLYCDNEFMNEAIRLNKHVYQDQCIIKHEHPCGNPAVENDALYRVNDAFTHQDQQTYLRRKPVPAFDLSILICTMPVRAITFAALLAQIQAELLKFPAFKVEVLFDDTFPLAVGTKRNVLLARAQGKYCAFIDDDDEITKYYFSVLHTALVVQRAQNYDAVALNGRYYFNKQYVKPFIHSNKYQTYSEDARAFYRFPNHFNAIKTDIARRIWFPSISFSEDTEFATKLKQSQLIKREYTHNFVQYHYYFVHKPAANSV